MFLRSAISPEDQQFLIFEAWKYFLNDSNTCFLETETTGLNDESEVIELGIVHVSGRTLFHQYFMPSIPIEPEAVEIHGLTKEKLAAFGAVDWSDKHAKISDILRRATTTSQVVTWDKYFNSEVLDVTTDNHSHDMIVYKLYSVMIAYNMCVPTTKKIVSLEEAAQREGINVPTSYATIMKCQTVLAMMQSLVSKYYAK